MLLAFVSRMLLVRAVYQSLRKGGCRVGKLSSVSFCCTYTAGRVLVRGGAGRPRHRDANGRPKVHQARLATPPPGDGDPYHRRESLSQNLGKFLVKLGFMGTFD